MIREDYVSFETAKLLKEKGFDVPYYYCSRVYSEHGTLQGVSSVQFPNVKYISAPTLQMAMKWLREVHNLHIITIPYAPMDRHPSHHPGEADVVYIAQLFRGIIPIDEIGRSIIKLTHEEACEEAIKYCLENLI